MTSASAAPSADEHSMMGPGRGRLEGKVAVITGANSGIGRAAARLFAREGAKVVCVDVAEVIAPRIDALIESDGGEAVFFKADVTSPESCQGMVALALERFGGLDVLVNNAGTGVFGRVDELTFEDWSGLLDINLNSVFLGSKAALPHMMEQGRGSIINTASTFGAASGEQVRCLLRIEGGGNPLDPEHGHRLRAHGHPGELSLPRGHRHAKADSGLDTGEEP